MLTHHSRLDWRQGFNVNENQPISSQLQTALGLRAYHGETEGAVTKEEIYGERRKERQSTLQSSK